MQKRLSIKNKRAKVNYVVKSPILGFENINEVKLEKIDDMFVIIKDIKNRYTSLTLVNPYMLQEYSFDIPLSIKTLMDINEHSKLSVYNVVIIQSPLDMSLVNFLAPFIFNEDNKTVAQIVLNEQFYPYFKMAQPIKDLIENR